MNSWTSRLKWSQSIDPSLGAMNPSRLQAAPYVTMRIVNPPRERVVVQEAPTLYTTLAFSFKLYDRLETSSPLL